MRRGKGGNAWMDGPLELRRVGQAGDGEKVIF